MLESACVAFSAVFMSDDDDVSIVPASKRRAIGAKDTGAVADSPIGKPVGVVKTKKAMKVPPKKRSNQRRLPKEEPGDFCCCCD